MSWPEPPPPPPASWGASSIVSEANAENLASGAEELKVQQEKMMEATTRLLSVVSEVGGGPWEASPGLTERALTEWMGEQEDRVDELRERLKQKQGELARLAEVEEADLEDLEADLEEQRWLREQESSGRDHRAPKQDRREDGNRLHNPSEVSLLSRQTESRERERREGA